MIPQRLAERLRMMKQDPEKIYSVRPMKAGLAGEEPVPWMSGFFFSSDSEMSIDAASFVPIIALDPNPGETILDMAAAPGMKTVLMARLMQNKGKIVACEIDRKRILRLKNNIRKFECSICKTVRCDASRLKWNEKFDKVLLDAPCSGEGMVSKQKKVFKIWSEKRIMKLQKMQKKMIKHGFNLLKDNGILVYSTCTFAPEENEEVVSWLTENNEGAKIERISISKLIHSQGISEWNEKKFPDHDKFIRIWPQQNSTNGMFVARVRRI